MHNCRWRQPWLELQPAEETLSVWGWGIPCGHSRCKEGTLGAWMGEWLALGSRLMEGDRDAVREDSGDEEYGGKQYCMVTK